MYVVQKKDLGLLPQPPMLVPRSEETMCRPSPRKSVLWGTLGIPKKRVRTRGVWLKRSGECKREY